MKKDKLNIILVLIFMVGLSVMLYPSISDYWNSRVQTQAVASYNNTVRNMPKEEYDRLFKEAEQYNTKLQELEFPFTNYDKVEGYKDIMNISGTGIMGYITIDRIKVELPIYHGTSDGVLQVAVGHLEGSSLPVGGKGNHCVLSAHRGLPSAKLFTNLDKMEEGDTFQITVLNRHITYEVDQIKIVEPQEIEAIYADKEKDYCTLMTCTPYGINSHRLLVRGVRISGIENSTYVPAGAIEVNTSVVALVIAIFLLAFLAMVMLVISYVKSKRK